MMQQRIIYWSPFWNKVYSFRPITNLAFESNVIERIAACQVHHYLVSNNRYPKLQPVYCQSHGTETALLRVHIDIIQGHRQHLRLSTMASLLHCLQTQFGFPDTVPQWFESYIRNRFQKVVIGCTEFIPYFNPLRAYDMNTVFRQ